jgi:predicted lipoprotein with Yx(FWY)xxD motif
MKLLHSIRLRAFGIALGAIGGIAVLLAAAAYGGTPAAAHHKSAAGALVSLRKTTLGSILVDSRGHTLYLFEKDRNGMSACTAACVSYWPALTSRAAPHAGNGVRQSMLHVVRQQNGFRQVTYAGHPLYTFTGDKSPGQTTGEGLTNFGAGWYALAASGQKVEPRQSSGGGYGGSGSGW